VQARLDSITGIERAKAIEKLKKFFFYSALSIRYTEGVESKLKDDCKEIINWLANDKAEPKFISKGVDWNINTILEYDQSGAFGKAIMCIINSQNPKDFFQDKTVGIGNELDKCDMHHIFSKSYYKSKSSIKSVINITFLLDKTNSSINDKPVEKYVAEIQDIPGLTESGLVSKLERHFIKGNTFTALKESRFEEFVIRRADEFKEYIKKNLGITINELVDGVPSDESIDDSDIE
jgi:hypothetical protein